MTKTKKKLLNADLKCTKDLGENDIQTFHLCGK